MQFRDAHPQDESRLLALLPQLADFSVPAGREPQDLWMGDAKLLTEHLNGRATDVFCRVAVDERDCLGFVLVTMRPEPMSGAPSAHLEAIVVAPEARGRGVGEALLNHAETHAKSQGATSLTLHVFSNNQRARNLYRKAGFDEELIRCTKPLK